ncbi:MAG: hypothetical protein ACUVUR_06130 [bacterium]
MPNAGITITVPFGLERDWRFGTEPERPGTEAVARFIAGLTREIRTRSKEFRSELFTTVYLGGCGPSTLTLDQLYQILQALYDNLTIQTEEQTLVVLPGTLNKERANVLRESGFDQMTVRMSSRTAFSVIEEQFSILRQSKFFSVGLEIVTPELMEPGEPVCRLRPDHITLGAFFQGKGYETGNPLPVNHQTAGLKQLLSGYKEYLPAHFAQPGKENRHLIALSSTATVAGFGPGAFSRKQDKTFRNPVYLSEYLRAV